MACFSCCVSHIFGTVCLFKHCCHFPIVWTSAPSCPGTSQGLADTRLPFKILRLLLKVPIVYAPFSCFPQASESSLNTEADGTGTFLFQPIPSQQTNVVTSLLGRGSPWPPVLCHVVEDSDWWLVHPVVSALVLSTGQLETVWPELGYARTGQHEAVLPVCVCASWHLCALTGSCVVGVFLCSWADANPSSTTVYLHV